VESNKKSSPSNVSTQTCWVKGEDRHREVLIFVSGMTGLKPCRWRLGGTAFYTCETSGGLAGKNTKEKNKGGNGGG